MSPGPASLNSRKAAAPSSQDRASEFSAALARALEESVEVSELTSIVTLSNSADAQYTHKGICVAHSNTS